MADSFPPRRAPFDGLHQSQNVLNMVGNFVGDDIGLGEITGGVMPSFEFVKESRVDVDLPIGRAIKRPHGRTGSTATGVDRAGKNRQRWRWVVGATFQAFPEQFFPNIFGILEHHRDEFAGFIILRRNILDLLLSRITGINRIE